MIEFSLRNQTLRAAILGALTLPAQSVLAAGMDFNTDILATRGISTNLAHYFSQAQRYLPGPHAVQVKINGVDKGTLAIRVGEEGQPVSYTHLPDQAIELGELSAWLSQAVR